MSYILIENITSSGSFQPLFLDPLGGIFCVCAFLTHPVHCGKLSTENNN